jgi:hypothetical protein
MKGAPEAPASQTKQLELPLPREEEPLADSLLWKMIRDEYVNLLVKEGFYSPALRSATLAADNDTRLFRRAVENTGCKVLAIRRQDK